MIFFFNIYELFFPFVVLVLIRLMLTPIQSLFEETEIVNLQKDTNFAMSE